MVSLAIVGAGRIAHSHAAAAAALGMRIAAVIDADAVAAAAFADRWGAAWSGAALVDCDLPLDGVIVCSPTALHHGHALAAIARGLPVLVEKPFAIDPERARTVIDAGAAAGVPVLAAQLLRFLPMFTWAREAIAGGVLGRPVQAIERRLVDRADNFPWWAELPAFLVSHWGSHSIDLLCSLFDDHATEVLCQADSIRSDFGVVDDFGLQLRFASGARAVSVMSFSSRLVLHDLVIVGTEATFSFECYRTASLDGELVLELPEQEMLDRGFQAQLTAFAAVIGGAPSLADAQTALPALYALHAAERSALGGGLIRIENPQAPSR